MVPTRDDTRKYARVWIIYDSTGTSYTETKTSYTCAGNSCWVNAYADTLPFYYHLGEFAAVLESGNKPKEEVKKSLHWYAYFYLPKPYLFSLSRKLLIDNRVLVRLLACKMSGKRDFKPLMKVQDAEEADEEVV